jgi:hypothetical protein
MSEPIRSYPDTQKLAVLARRVGGTGIGACVAKDVTQRLKDLRWVLNLMKLTEVNR